MKLSSALSLLLAAATTISAIPLEDGIGGIEQRSATSVDSGTFEFEEGALEKRAAHIVLQNNLPNPLEYQFNDNGAKKTLAQGHSVNLPYPGLNQAGYKIYMRHVGGHEYFLAEYATGNGDGGGNKISYNFSIAGPASDPFLHEPKSFIPLSNQGKSGYNCITIFCKPGSDQCAAMNGERLERRADGSFPLGSCPASTVMKIVMGPR